MAPAIPTLQALAGALLSILLNAALKALNKVLRNTFIHRLSIVAQHFL